MERQSLHSDVVVSYLSQEELMKYRVGAKCDLEYRNDAKRSIVYKRRQQNGRKEGYMFANRH